MGNSFFTHEKSHKAGYSTMTRLQRQSSNPGSKDAVSEHHIESQPMLQNNSPCQRRQAETVDLPEHIINSLKYHWHVLENQSLGTEIREKDGTQFLHVPSEELYFIFNELSKICSRQILVEAARVSYLDSSEGHGATETIEQRNKCVVRTHPPSILLRVTSPLGHRVCVCEGSIAHHDCQVLVLLLHRDQEMWSPQICRILQKERLARKDVEPVPKEGIQIEYCSTNSNLEVVRIYVPSRINHKEVQNIQEALTKVMRRAAREAKSIAVPFDLISEHIKKRKDSLKVMLQSIVETFNEKVPVCCLLKLYLEEGHADKSKLCEITSTFLSRWRSFGPCEFARDRSIKMVVADILDMEADVLVNSASRNLDLEKGKLSKVLLKNAGPELSQQCKERYPEGLADRVVAVTDCFQLETFINIFHIFLSPWPEKTEGQTERAIHSRLDWIRTCTQTCLTLASAMNYTSIVFPTLGMGTLGYPAKQVAETMFTTFRQFFFEMPQSSLHEVTVVCFHTDVSGFQNFKMVETRFALQQNADIVLEAKGVQIQIVQGNSQQQICPADFVVLGNRAGTEHFGHKEDSVFSVDEDHLQRRIETIFSSTEARRVGPFCLHIHLETFSCNFQLVVAEVKKYLSAAKNLKLVTLVVPSSEDPINVCTAFKKAKKLHVPDQGGKSTASSDASFGSLTICGTLSSIRNAGEEIRALPIPDEFRTRKSSQSGIEGSHRHQKRGPGSIQGRTKGTEEILAQPIPDEFQTGRSRQEIGLESGIDGSYRHQKRGHGSRRTKDIEEVAGKETYRLEGVPPEVPLSSSSKERAWSKEVDVLENEALQFLLREKFMDNFISQDKSGDKVLIEAKMANPPEEIIRKMDEIRREDMEIESQHAALTFDTESEGLEVYIRVLPHQSGVALFCFDNTTMAKAKNFVNVKTGKIKITSRNRRFDDGSGSRQMADKAPETGRTWQQQTSMVDLTTPVARIKVSVYKTDITKLPVDAIVNAANEHLSHGSGVANAISRAAGFTLESEGDDYVKQHGPLKVAQVIATTGGNLLCKKVLHAVGPRWADYPDKSLCCQALTDTVFNCLSLASHSGFTSLAVASISSAIFGVPQQTCAECYLAAVQRFDGECGGKTSLSHIHFVDVNDTMVSVIQDTFRSSWDTPVRGRGSIQGRTRGTEKIRAQPIPDEFQTRRSSQEVELESGIDGSHRHQKRGHGSIQGRTKGTEEIRAQPISDEFQTRRSSQEVELESGIDGSHRHQKRGHGSIQGRTKGTEEIRAQPIPDEFQTRRSSQEVELESGIDGSHRHQKRGRGSIQGRTKGTEEILAQPIPDEFQTRRSSQEVELESGIDGSHRHQKRGRGSIQGRTKGTEEILAQPIPDEFHKRRSPQEIDWESGSRRTKDTEEAGKETYRLEGVPPEVPLSSSSKERAWSKEVDVLENEALQFLLREKFMDNFISQEKAGDKVLIEAKMANPPEEIIRKMDEIRREDMEIDSQHAALTFDTESEGLEAYIRVLPHQSGIALFCFDYTTMAKAKHFVNVKTGKIKITSRNRRSDDGTGSRQMADKAPETERAWQQQTSMVDLTTPVARIKVSVYKTNITKLPVDAIVITASEQLAHGDEVAYAIAGAAGFTLESEGDDYVKQHGPLKVAQVIATTGGNLPCKKVLHAVGPRWADYPDKSLCCQALTDTVFNCLSLASHSGFTSLAVASISSAIFGVPQQTCAECYLAAVQRFDGECGGKTSLSHIHFVDVNDTMVSVIQDTFRSSWDTPVRGQQLGCPVPPSAGDGAVSESARSRRRRQQQQEASSPEV